MMWPYLAAIYLDEEMQNSVQKLCDFFSYSEPNNFISVM